VQALGIDPGWERADRIDESGKLGGGVGRKRPGAVGERPVEQAPSGTAGESPEGRDKSIRHRIGLEAPGDESVDEVFPIIGACRVDVTEPACLLV
jgi:hypothetical protein